MRLSLFTAAAAAPLLLLAAGPALAATTIGDARTTPVATSTANSGQPDDVTISSSGSVTVTGPVAVTLDSNNLLSNGGAITIKDVDSATAVLLLGGHTGTFTNAGSISVTESYTPTDTNNDGVVDGAFAKGTGRYGVRLTGPSAFIGNITSDANGSVAVQGNNSFGVSLEAPIQGDVTNGGGVNVLGDHSVGYSVSGGVTGKTVFTGGVTATGAGTIGVDISGNVGGRFAIYSSITSTGYRLTARPSDPAAVAKLLPENVQLSGSAVQVRADVLGGVFIGAAPTTTVATDTTTDADGDGIVDSAESPGAITTFGSAPALKIGAAGRDVHLGAFGTGVNAFGLIVRGGVTGDGVYDTLPGTTTPIPGTGIQIGEVGGTVHLDGGMRVVGSVLGSGHESDGTGVHILAGSVIPQIDNEGGITGGSTSKLATSGTAVLIEAGAVVNSLSNSGILAGGVTGDLASAYGLVDRSGTLSNVVNTDTIRGLVVGSSTISNPAGQSVALDLSANTTGVTLTQSANSSATLIPAIQGDIRLGSGPDTVQFLAGTVNGALDFGAGQGSILVDNGASFQGRLLSTGVLAITVNKGLLEDESAGVLHASSLTVGSSGVLNVSADPANGTATLISVAGPAVIASGGRIGLHLVSLPSASLNATVVQASSLSVSTADTDLTANAPYLFVAGFHSDPTAGTVMLNLRRRTAAEANLNRAEASALDPVYSNLSLDQNIQRAFLAQTDRSGLVSMVDQMLPDHSGGVFRALAWAAEAQGMAAGSPPVGQEQAGPTRAWTQEIVLHEQKDRAQTLGYGTLGFGAVGGIESVSAKGDALGVKFGFVAANIRNPDLPSDNLLGLSELNAGVYWRGQFGKLKADAQLGAGYVRLDGRREFLFSDTTGVVHRVAQARWSGYTLSGRVGVQYAADMGGFFIQPGVHADFFRAHEGGYTEHGGGNGFDLAVGGRSGDMLSVTGGVTAGRTFGTGFRWRPQVELGYRAVLAGSAGNTSGSFVGGSGGGFLLASEPIPKGAAIGRVGLRVYSDYLDLLLDAGGEFANDYTDIDVHLTARTMF